MVGSQIANLIFGLFFCHNLCFRCSNGSCKPILDIYVLRAFPWYKKFVNWMGFDPCNCFLKIWECIGTPTPKVEVHLRVWRFNFHTLPYSQPPRNMKCDSWASLLAHTFASLYFGCEPNVRVATLGLTKLDPLHFRRRWFVITCTGNLAPTSLFSIWVHAI